MFSVLSKNTYIFNATCKFSTNTDFITVVDINLCLHALQIEYKFNISWLRITTIITPTPFVNNSCFIWNLLHSTLDFGAFVLKPEPEDTLQSTAGYPQNWQADIKNTIVCYCEYNVHVHKRRILPYLCAENVSYCMTLLIHVPIHIHSSMHSWYAPNSRLFIHHCTGRSIFILLALSTTQGGVCKSNWIKFWKCSS